MAGFERTINVGLILSVCAAAQTAAPAHFHHLHLNSTDPAAAIAFYTRTFDCEAGSYKGADAVWSQKSWLLFNKAPAAPPAAIVSPIWHFGWGAEDMKAEYEKQIAKGTQFLTPLSQIYSIFYAYVDGPDRAIIEINTASHHHFGHLHLLSADPVKAADFYAIRFGATIRRTQTEPVFFKGYQIGPNASLMMDNVNIIIFPIEYARQQFAEDWKGRMEFAPTRGRVVDHIGFSVDDLVTAKAALARGGVKIDGDFVEGPDNIAIELVQGHASKE